MVYVFRSSKDTSMVSGETVVVKGEIKLNCEKFLLAVSSNSFAPAHEGFTGEPIKKPELTLALFVRGASKGPRLTG